MSLIRVLLVALAVLAGCSGSGTQPASQTIINGQVAIAAVEFQAYRFTVTSAMRNPVLRGEYTTIEGGSLDINAFVLDEANYTNWKNNNNFDAFYDKQRVTTGQFILSLQPGTYYFVLSNRFSLLTDKRVDAQVTLEYKEKAGKILPAGD